MNQPGQAHSIFKCHPKSRPHRKHLGWLKYVTVGYIVNLVLQLLLSLEAFNFWPVTMFVNMTHSVQLWADDG